VKNGVAWWTHGPVVSIATPETGTWFTAPGDIAVTASIATRDGGVQGVEFLSGTRKIGASTAPPYTFRWTGVKPGSYVLTARAVGSYGRNHTSYPVKITVAAAGMSKATIVNTSAGGEEQGNPKENSYDGKPNTRWASNSTLAAAWISYDLGSSQTVTGVSMRLFNGRILTYPIKIEVGDGSRMTQVWSGTTEWLEKTAQFFHVRATPGRYVKISMTDNNSHDDAYFSVYETEISVLRK
jgi:hypothetical protein